MSNAISSKLQMEHSFLNFLSSTLVPILCSNIAAGSSCNVHLILIAVAALGAFPNELAVVILLNKNLAIKTAFLAIVTLGIELSIHNVIVDKLHNL